MLGANSGLVALNESTKTSKSPESDFNKKLKLDSEIFQSNCLCHKKSF